MSGTTPQPRAANSADLSAIKSMAVDNGMFDLDEVDAFDELLAGSLDGSLAGHTWVVLDDEAGVPIGAAYLAPEPFSDRMWNLYFLAVRPGAHRAGAGGALIEHVEADLLSRGEDIARVLIVETSSLAGYAPARDFYRRHGFVEEARIREFYGPGDHKIVFWKSLA